MHALTECPFFSFAARFCNQGHVLRSYGRCYFVPNNHFYTLISYKDGVQECRDRSARVAEIHDRDQQQYLTRFIQRHA